MIATIKPLLSRLRLPAGGAPLLTPNLLKTLLPLTLLAVGITALVLMFLWREQAGYKPVFGGREKVAAADMMAVLDAEHIPYRVHPDNGQVLVPDGQLGKARMLLAAKGVVAKLPAGLELMDRNDPLGVSQFVQDVRFRRALEGELVQSIMTLDAVESARVHVAIAKSSSFVASDGEKSTASVVLALKPGRSLGPEQIAAIINLVAGSVAGLDPQRVKLVDQAGNFLSARVDLTEGFEAGQDNEPARRIQEETRRNVRELLAPVVGEDNYKVSVTAEVDNDRIQETHEQYGATPKVMSEAMRQEQDRDRLALGVPGSLSNRPIAVAPPEPDANKAAAPEANTAQKSATTRQYTYDRNISQIKRSRGRLQRLNVAVLLNTSVVPGGKAAWSAEDIAGVERMLSAGLGINAERGDKLTVSALPFPAKAEPVPWWEERDKQIEMGSWAVSALGMLLAYLLVARPLLRIAQQRLAPVPLIDADEFEAAQREAAELEAAQALPAEEAPAALGLPGSPNPVGMPVVPLLENYDLPPAGSPVDVMVDHLKVLAAKEPERVAEVVKQWVQKNEQAQ
ncbi:MAG: flagellar MS-ring protein [Rhodocyclaceae bacterium]|nr:flagellar MS-ring protein [Rhodocyclaceae bacterium]